MTAHEKLAKAFERLGTITRVVSGVITFFQSNNAYMECWFCGDIPQWSLILPEGVSEELSEDSYTRETVARNNAQLLAMADIEA